MAARIFFVIARSSAFICCWSAVGEVLSRSRLFVFVLSGAGSCRTELAIADPLKNKEAAPKNRLNILLADFITFLRSFSTETRSASPHVRGHAALRGYVLFHPLLACNDSESS